MKMSNGNFEIDITSDYEGSFSQIKDSVNKIIESLNNLFMSINNASEQVL